MAFRNRTLGILAAGIATVILFANAANADDEDHWVLLPKQVTAATLAARDASLVAATRVPKANGGALAITYWTTGQRTYRCIDQLDNLGGTVDAYCFRQKALKPAPTLKN